MSNMSSQIPSLGSYITDEDGSCDSSSDSDIELVGNPNSFLKKMLLNLLLIRHVLQMPKA